MSAVERRVREPVIPVTPERRERLLALQGYVILGRPPDANAYQGYVEHSFSMGWSEFSVNFFWSGPAKSNFGTSHKVDGKVNSDRYVESTRQLKPDWDIQAFDVRDPELPVILDWERWIGAHASDPNTLSGVTDKFEARNFRFEMRGDSEPVA